MLPKNVTFSHNDKSEADYFINITHRKKTQTVKFSDFSEKSTYSEVSGKPNSFEIIIDDIINTNSVDALVKYINHGLAFDIINESNAIDLSYLAKLYSFYNLMSATNEYMLTNVPINQVYEAFEKRKDVLGYIASFSFYITRNFKRFVHDPSIYSLPFNIIDDMLDQNLPNLTVDDIVTFTINTYYKQGKQALSLLSKVNSPNIKHKNSLKPTEGSTNSIEFVDNIQSEKSVIEQECSTECLSRLFCALCAERPFPYTQYITSIIRQRVTKNLNNKSEDLERKKVQTSNDISSIYIALLDLTQKKKAQAYKVLATLYEKEKASFIDAKSLVNIYLYLSEFPPPSNRTSEKNDQNDDRLSPDSSFDWGAHAFFMLYRIHSDGIPNQLNPNPPKALEYLVQSALRGYKNACIAIIPFIVSNECPINRQQAMDILKMSADFGNIQAQYTYGVNLSIPNTKLTNIIKAIHYLRLANQNGHPRALEHYLRISCVKNPDTANTCKGIYDKILKSNSEITEKIRLLKTISDCSYYPATFMLANITANLAPHTGLVSEYDIIARQYYEIATNKEINGSFFAYANYILKQASTDKDIEQAASLLEKGATAFQSDARFMYARLLMKGWKDHPKDLTQSIAILYGSMEANYIPAIKFLANIYEFGYDTIDPDENQFSNITKILNDQKDPFGIGKFLYNQISISVRTGKSRDDPQIITYVKQLKALADAMVSHPSNYTPLPIWLYAKILLEGRASDNDFKNAIHYLKKITDFIPAQVLLTSLSFSYSKIEKKSALSSIFRYIKHFKGNEFSSLPQSTEVMSKIQTSALNGDPSFRYKYGSILLDIEEDYERGFELIRQSADSGSLCGMTKYALLRLEGKVRPKNVYEGLTYLKKAGLLGFDSALLFYAKYAYNFTDLQKECAEILKELQFKVDANLNLAYNSETISQTDKVYNFVSDMSLNSIQTKSMLAFSTMYNTQQKTTVAEMQRFLETFINENEATGTKDNSQLAKTNQKYIAEAHFRYAQILLSQTTDLDNKNTPKAYIDKIYQQALEELKKSFELGYSTACAYYFDLLLNINSKMVATDFLLNNLYNSTFSLYKTGSMSLFDTTKTSLDQSTAIDLLKLATFLDDVSQYPDILWKFGTMLREGTVVAKDEESALQHFLQAAKYGSPAAAVSLGNAALLETVKAQKTIKSLHTTPLKLQNIIQTNSKVAYEYFHNASYTGFKEGIWCEAMCKLHGIGCDQDNHDFIRLLHKLSIKGDPDANYNLGKLAINISLASKQEIHFSKTVFQLGLKFMIMAAQQNHSIALYRLSLFVLRRQINPEIICMPLSIDPTLPVDFIATRLLKQSADLGNPNAASLFSLCLENGIGANRNLEMAKEYARIAGTNLEN